MAEADGRRRAQYARLARDMRAVQRQRAVSVAIAACGQLVAAAGRALATLSAAFTQAGRAVAPVLDAIGETHAADPELMHIWGSMAVADCPYCALHRGVHARDAAAFHTRHGIERGRCWWCREKTARPLPAGALGIKDPGRG